MAQKEKREVVNDDLISQAKMRLWIKNNYNVLFEGRHGVGKTHLILDAFDKAGLKYAYFSGSTMDPFIDFVGVPIKTVDSKGDPVIELIRPKHMAKGDIQAIFIDEFNRTHKKVRNAVMELMQFKTINGKPFSKDLRVVWAAINPEDEDQTYDVDRLDPAQKDRFHVYVQIPFQCSGTYFTEKYGEQGETAVKYWNALEKKIQSEVSPRRLDYALDLFAKGGDLRDALPPSVNPGRLQMLLKGKGYEDLKPLLNDPEKAKTFFRDELNYATYIGDVVKMRALHPLFGALLPEKLVALMAKPGVASMSVQRYVMKTFRQGGPQADALKPILEAVTAAGQSRKISNWCRRLLSRFPVQGSVPVRGTRPTRSGRQSRLDLLKNHMNQPGVNQYTLSSLQSLVRSKSAHYTEYQVDKKVVPWLKAQGRGISKAGTTWRVA